MIIQEQKVVSNFDSQDFKIKANSKAFKILSSNLYKDKILAICRELICNAYDSHVQAGKKDIPVVVTVPTAANPNFIVEDFGLGLSKEEVEQIYTTYFESTKTNTNELIGGLGLGSKSPFAYTTSFTVIATKDEICNTFVAFIGEGGLPQISLLVTQPVPGKSNGVRVEVPVQSSDCYLFCDSLAKLQWFETVPEVIGYDGLMTQHCLFDELNEYGFATKSSWQKNRIAVMGTVDYPISIQHVEGADELLSQIIDFTSYDTSIYLKFDIGELDIAPSREELSYDKKTQEVILKKLQWLYAQLKQRYQAITTDESLSLSERLLKLTQHGYKNTDSIQVFIDQYCKQHTPTDMTLPSRIYKTSNSWRTKPCTENVNLSVNGSRYFHTHVYRLSQSSVMFVNCPNDKSISRIVSDILMYYKVSTVIEVYEIAPEQKKYIKDIFGVDVHELNDVRTKIKEQKPKDERKQYAVDRIVVDGNEMLLTTKDPKTTKFLTDEYYLSFYSTLYPDADIYKVSKIYLGKIERNGFEVLNCSRPKTYTDDEVKLLMGNIAETMSKEEFNDYVTTIAIHSGHIYFGDEDRDTPTWFKFNRLFKLYKKEILSVIDIPDNFNYNVKRGKLNVTIDAKVAIANLYENDLTVKLKAITEENPILYLVNRSSCPQDIEIVLNLLKKA